VQVIFFNLLYDLVKAHGGEWEPVQKALSADPYVCPHYTTPVHKGGRGAGGHCFIKDFAAFEALYAAALPNDERGKRLLSATAEKNRALLTESGKDAHILADVYGAKGT
jgi:UDP-glucose 6-dehydrogenase